MICFRDRTYCSALCRTEDCTRRWTRRLQDDANAWWNPKRDPLVGGAPVAFSDFSPQCPAYNPPGEVGAQLADGQTNPKVEP